MGKGAATFAFALAIGLATVVAGTATGKPTNSCATQDGRYVVGEGWTDGVVAPGVTVESASEEEIVFTVVKGFTLDSVCVRSGSEFDKYSIDRSLPLNGPQTVTVSKLARSPGLVQISFDTKVTPVTCEEFQPVDIEFDTPVVVDRNRAGGEPVTVVAQDGSISLSAHAGSTHVYKNPTAAGGAADFAVGYFNQTLNWRSTDGGKNWKYIGLLGTGEGPHSATSTGFSDPDFAIDQAGNIYNVEIDLVNNAVFKSTDDGQSYPIAHPNVFPGDRPWVAALEKDEVFLYISNVLVSFWVSRDPNLLQWTRLSNPPIDRSKPLTDPLNKDDGLIGAASQSGSVARFAMTANDGQSWTVKNMGRLDTSRQFFGVVGVDNAGNVYQAAAGGYNGPGDTNWWGDDRTTEPRGGGVTFTFHERATGRTNGTRPEDIIRIPMTTPGDALWPWIIAGDDGRVAVAWYQNSVTNPRHFYPYVAVSHNAHGTNLECSDGTTKYVAPQWDVEQVTPAPIHKGDICLAGTNCNAATTFDGGDRRLGDFYTVNFDHTGKVMIATADTVVANSNPLAGLTGAQEPVGNPVFVKQKSGPGLLKEPMQLRPTRPLSLPGPPNR